jgi:hypothetical protein
MQSSPLGRTDAIVTGTLDESSEDEVAALVLRIRDCCEGRNGEGGRSERMPPHRDVVCTLKVLIVPASGLLWVSRDEIEGDCVIPWAIRTAE